MKELRNIRTAADARLTVLRDRIRLSARACHLLGIRPTEPYIMFHEDNGKVYISNAHSAQGYRTTPYQHRVVVNSTSLSRTLAELLDGYGIYKILEDEYTFDKGTSCYRISNEKYRK